MRRSPQGVIGAPSPLPLTRGAPGHGRQLPNAAGQQVLAVPQVDTKHLVLGRVLVGGQGVQVRPDAGYGSLRMSRRRGGSRGSRGQKAGAEGRGAGLYAGSCPPTSDPSVVWLAWICSSSAADWLVAIASMLCSGLYSPSTGSSLLGDTASRGRQGVLLWSGQRQGKRKRQRKRKAEP